MVQTYGVAPNTVAGEGSDESSALLGSDRHVPLEPVTYKKEGYASLTSCVSNLSKTIIGSGMLTFPLAMASAGIIPEVITCIFCGCTAGFGLYLLSLCATKTPHRRSSFFAVAQLTYPRAAVFFDAAIAIKCLGVSFSYLIIIKNLMPNVVASLYHDLTSPDTNPPKWALNGTNWLLIFMIVLVPLCFLRRLDSLRHASYIALFSVAYLVLIVVRCYFWPLEDMPSRGEVHLIHFTPDFVSTFPVQVFAFTCSQNLFPLYNEVTNNTQTRMNTIIGGSIGGAVIIYEIIAIFGYLTFGSKVAANIIAMYPSTSLFIAVGQLAIVSLVLLSYPLQVHPCRNCLDKVFHFSHTLKSVSVDEHESEDEGMLDEDHASTDMSTLKHTVLTTAILTLGFSVAFIVDDLKMVLSFVGSTGSTTISFILPGLFYWKLFQDDPSARTKRLGALVLMMYGVCIFIFCLGFNVYQIMQE
ncbi:vacuolar amino acid transporter 5 [Amanita muscaria]